jgi:hypothetical protein
MRREYGGVGELARASGVRTLKLVAACCCLSLTRKLVSILMRNTLLLSHDIASFR